jgi:hypothetical protein
MIAAFRSRLAIVRSAHKKADGIRAARFHLAEGRTSNFDRIRFAKES